MTRDNPVIFKKKRNMLVPQRLLRVVVLPPVIVVLFLFALVHHLSSSTSYSSSPAIKSGRSYHEHPISRLAADAQKSFNLTISKQSRSLDEAVAEYKRRYRMPPPPQFDKWYKYAVDQGTVLIDEYDNIFDILLPFWGVKPSVLRARVREDLGHPNNLAGFVIRNGKVAVPDEARGDFNVGGMANIVDPFAQWLPDMDFAINPHDEPRIVVPSDELDLMVKNGRDAQSRLNARGRNVAGKFSPTPEELLEPIAEEPKSRYNDIEHQETWLPSVLSCPIDSPARDVDGESFDDFKSFATEPLGFIYNSTAFTDICLSPSLRHRIGIFDRPHAFKITHEPSLAFSNSKLSLNQDLLYPSIWYFGDSVSSEEASSIAWEDKFPQMYWRGHTSGGQSEAGTWRTQLRQSVLGKFVAPTPKSKILQRKSGGNNNRGFGLKSVMSSDSWQLREVESADYSHYFNLKFTGIVQCTPQDCADMHSFFEPVETEPRTEAWKYRYLLDMDGNAYSGRFYGFMRSNSVPMKLSYFREWHSNTLFPWLHYVPLSYEAMEYIEIIRYFEQDPEGQKIARHIAEAGREWTGKALNKGTMHVWMFRMLLE